MQSSQNHAWFLFKERTVSVNTSSMGCLETIWSMRDTYLVWQGRRNRDIEQQRNGCEVSGTMQQARRKTRYRLYKDTTACRACLNGRTHTIYFVWKVYFQRQWSDLQTAVCLCEITLALNLALLCAFLCNAWSVRKFVLNWHYKCQHVHSSHKFSCKMNIGRLLWTIVVGGWS